MRNFQWTSNGQKICIIYADGAVIVGSVDGNRLWGKELDMGLQNVEWSPDGRRLVHSSSTVPPVSRSEEIPLAVWFGPVRNRASKIGCPTYRGCAFLWVCPDIVCASTRGLKPL